MQHYNSWAKFFGEHTVYKWHSRQIKQTNKPSMQQIVKPSLVVFKIASSNLRKKKLTLRTVVWKVQMELIYACKFDFFTFICENWIDYRIHELWIFLYTVFCRSTFIFLHIIMDEYNYVGSEWFKVFIMFLFLSKKVVNTW